MLIEKRTNCKYCGSSMTRSTMKNDYLTIAAYECSECTNVLTTVIAVNGRTDGPRPIISSTSNTTKKSLLDQGFALSP